VPEVANKPVLVEESVPNEPWQQTGPA
jgi:hypothetical protein